MSRQMLTSFLRLDLTNAMANGDLSKWAEDSTSPLKRKQIEMVEFARKILTLQIPGGLENVIEIKVYDEGGDRRSYDYTLKKSATTIAKERMELEAKREQDARVQAFVKKMIKDAEELFTKAKKVLKKNDAQLCEMIFSSPQPTKMLQDLITKAESRQTSAAKTKAANKGPVVEFKPAQLTGKVVQLPRPRARM